VKGGPDEPGTPVGTESVGTIAMPREGPEGQGGRGVARGLTGSAHQAPSPPTQVKRRTTMARTPDRRSPLDRVDWPEPGEQRDTDDQDDTHHRMG